MDRLSKDWYMLRFQVRYYKRQMTAFEDFFCDLMEARHGEDFQRIRPAGNQGDWGCDGLLKSKGWVFQAYAPRQMIASKFRSKVQGSFARALSKQSSGMKRWILVHNDPEGITAEMEALLRQFEQENPGISTGVWGEQDLWRLVEEMPDEAREYVLGMAPTERDLDGVGYSEIQGILQHLAASKPPAVVELTPPSPEKLKRNNLSEASADLLALGRRREYLVKEYLDSSADAELGDRISEAFSRRYRELVGESGTPDEIVQDLIIFAGGNRQGTPVEQAAVLAVLSYLFERCDIFEDPEEQP
jgi:hypothetical protein